MFEPERNPFKKSWKTLAACICLLSLFGAACFFYWKKGTPYGQPFWSPNNQFYVQKYANWTSSSFYPAPPGQGSEAADGYVRLYDKNGNLIKEEFAIGIEYINKPIWTDNKVYIRMIAEDEPWILPAGSE